MSNFPGTCDAKLKDSFTLSATNEESKRNIIYSCYWRKKLDGRVELPSLKTAEAQRLVRPVASNVQSVPERNSRELVKSNIGHIFNTFPSKSSHGNRDNRVRVPSSTDALVTFLRLNFKSSMQRHMWRCSTQTN